MIKTIDKLPSSPADENKAKRDGMMWDVYGDKCHWARYRMEATT